MTISEINTLPDKAHVPELEGRIVTVHEPRPPTPAQQRVGIHSQDVLIQDGYGDEVMLQIKDAKQHLPKSAEDMVYHFRSVDGKGLSMNRWQGDRGEVVCVQVDKGAHLYQVKESPEEVKAYQDSKPQIGDKIAFYTKIMRGLEADLQGTTIWEAMLQHPESIASATATIFIAGEKCEMDKKPKDVTQARPPEPPPESNGAERPSIAEGQALADLGELALAKIIVDGQSSAYIKECVASVDGMDFLKVYDHIFALLEKEGWAASDIDKCLARVDKLIEKKLGKRPSDHQLYSSVAYNFPSFREQLKLLRPTPDKQPEPEGAGLPALD